MSLIVLFKIYSYKVKLYIMYTVVNPKGETVILFFVLIIKYWKNTKFDKGIKLILIL